MEECSGRVLDSNGNKVLIDTCGCIADQENTSVMSGKREGGDGGEGVHIAGREWPKPRGENFHSELKPMHVVLQ